MATIESWDPSASGLTDRHRDILNSAVERAQSNSMDLPEEAQGVLRPTMHLDEDVWIRFAEKEPSDRLVAWIKALTLIERDLSGFECGGKSPVLKLIKLLKARDELPGDLFGWIRRNTNNRFLPYGSLADRL